MRGSDVTSLPGASQFANRSGAATRNDELFLGPSAPFDLESRNSQEHRKATMNRPSSGRETWHWIVATLLLSAANPLFAQPAGRDGYLDFRNKKPLSDAFRFGGFDPDSETKPEQEGLRVTLPAERGQHFLSEVNVNFHVAGDFEFTATYEILSAKPPVEGYGVGVNLTISTDTQPPKFGKLARVLHPKHGSTVVAEVWPKFKNKPKPSDAM